MLRELAELCAHVGVVDVVRLQPTRIPENDEDEATSPPNALLITVEKDDALAQRALPDYLRTTPLTFRVVGSALAVDLAYRRTHLMVHRAGMVRK